MVQLSRQGQHAQALSTAQALADSGPKDPRVFYQISLVQLEADRPQECLLTLDQSRSLEKHSPVECLYRALALGQLQRWSEATQAAQELHQLSPHHQFTPTLRCYLHLGQGEVAAAIADLQIDRPAGWVSWFRPELSPFAPLLSRLLVVLERYLLSVEFPQLHRSEALQEPPPLEVVPTHFSLKALKDSVEGYFWQRKGLHHWEQALSCQDPHKRYALLGKAVLAHRKANQLEPRQFRGQYHLGESLLYSAVAPDGSFDLDRLANAERCFLHSWAQEGPNPYLYFHLGRTLQLQGKPEAARTYLERALEKFTKFPEAHYALGQIHLVMGQEETARGWFKQSVSSDFLPVARERLLELGDFHKKGKFSEGIKMPSWPPPALPTADNGPTESHPQSVQIDSFSTEETAESRQCEVPNSPPESHETSPAAPDPPPTDNPSSPQAEGCPH